MTITHTIKPPLFYFFCDYIQTFPTIVTKILYIPIMSSTIAAGAADHGGDAPITAIHSDIIQSHILNRLDGPTLASTCCASAQLRSLCGEDRLWREICNSTWPSSAHPTVRDAISAFPSGHRSFYSDAFPTVRCHGKTDSRTHVPETSEFISAVDIYCDDQLVYSKVTVTETLSSWFLSSPFRLDLLGHKETVLTPLKFDGEDGACMELPKERLRISWILIDPSKKRAMNIASLKAVEARRHWLTEDAQLRYATVVDGGADEMVQCAVLVSCGGKEGGELQVREVSMQLEDMEGKVLTGLDSLVILDTVMEGQRWKSDVKMQKDMFDMFRRMKVHHRERNHRGERNFDTLCIAAGVSIFFLIWSFFYYRN